MSSLYELKKPKRLNELQNYLLSFCKSKLPGTFKIASLTELIRNIHRKSLAVTFQIENPGIVNEFSIVGMDWILSQISNEPSLAKSEFFNSLSNPTFAEKEKALDK